MVKSSNERNERVERLGEERRWLGLEAKKLPDKQTDTEETGK